MKPVYLEFCGINSFSERAEVDFKALLEFGLFGIFGDTGSGKSTVLDCICFALYGDVTRLGSKTAGLADFINYKSDRAYVNFVFELDFDGRKTYRVERELRRRATLLHNVKVYEVKPDGGMSVVSDGVKDCKQFLENLIGLEQSDFEKCIALPQGEFAQFVKSTPSERLRIVSRLFDLERYGKSLVARAGERYSAEKRAADVLQAKLELYTDVSKESVNALKEEIAALTKEEAERRAALEKLREHERAAADAAEKRKEADGLLARQKALDAQKEEVQKSESELSRLDGAANVAAAHREYARAAESLALARTAYAEVQKRAENASAELAQAMKWDAEKADAEIVRYTELRALSQTAQEQEKRVTAIEERLAAVRREFAEEREQFKNFSYERERGRIEGELAALGEGDFALFVEQSGKNALFRAEYAQVKKEFEELTARHEEIAPDTAPYIQKYAALSQGESLDFAQAKRAYEAREQARKKGQQSLIDLEKRNARYKVHCERLQRLETDGHRLKEELDAEKKGIKERVPPLAEIERTLLRLKQEKTEKSQALERARERQARAGEELAAARERGQNLAQAEKEAAERLKGALAAGKFQSAEEAETLAAKYGNADEVRARVKAYGEEVVAVRARLKDLNAESLPPVDGETFAHVKEELKAAEEKCNALFGTLAFKRGEIERGEKRLLEKQALKTEYSAAEKRAELYERLKKLLEGNKFMEFVAEEHLQTVAINASVRLLSLTEGRYFLRYDKGFFVGDNYNAGQLRGVYTLSGGETFLVSLSLALALSQEICARSLRPIEFFFLDEGFGTLDERLVDTVMNSLEKLKGEHFSIGIISHVEELKHRIDRKLLVHKATEKRGSQIEIE